MIPKLMKLLADMTGWGNRSCRVEIGFMPAESRDADGDRQIDNTDWGYVASTTICGDSSKNRIDAQGKTLEEALEALARAVLKRMDDRLSWWDNSVHKASNMLQVYITDKASGQDR